MRKRIFPIPDREEILTGRPLRTMAKIGGPAVVSSLLFTLYNLADAFWIGRLPTDQAGSVMAGIQISWPFVWFIISFVAGFGGAAVSALVAQYIGANRHQEARFAFNQLITLSAFASVILGVVGFFLAPVILKLLIQEPQVAHEASLYLSVIFLGLPTMVFPGLFYHAYSATGDTVTPLLVNIVGVLINVTLDPFLILGWGPFPQMGILGAAYATVIAQSAAMIIFLLLFLKGNGLLRIDRPALRLRWEWMTKAMKIGLPAGIGQSTVAFGFVVLMWVIGRLDNAEAALAGYGIADRIFGIMFIVTNSMCIGLTTMIGQALGAGLQDRARELMRKGLAAMFVILIFEASFLWLIRVSLVSTFMPGNTAVIHAGSRFLELFALGMPFLGAFFIAESVYRGSGHNVPPMILGVARLWLLRIPLAYVFAFILKMGSDGVWIGMSASNVISGLAAFGLLSSRSWLRSVVEPEDKEASASW
ncbi:MAG: MATE family efflux transporter [Candidatus Atribacteria bacterium]|nr:MAG: MATE family efflux transporter [Candidatus Atribacteria bacterium]